MVHRIDSALRALVLVMMVASVIQTRAQETLRFNDAWFLLLNHVEVGEKWQVGNELHWRMTDWVATSEQLIIRPFVTYQCVDGVQLAGGYSYLASHPYRNDAARIVQPEHNFWEQVTLSHKVGVVNVAHRYRLEHRYRGQVVVASDESLAIEGFSYGERFRYRLIIKVPINSEWFVHIFDEYWVRMNAGLKQPTYDRNWLYAGIGRKFAGSGNIQLAYLHQHTNFGSFYEVHPTVQLTVQYDLKRD